MARSVRDAAIASGVARRELVVEMNQDSLMNETFKFISTNYYVFNLKIFYDLYSFFLASKRASLPSKL